MLNLEGKEYEFKALIMKSENKKSVGLLVFSCDQYELLFEGFDFFFKKNWGQINDVECYFSTETLDLKIEGYKSLKSGTGEWTNRLKRTLSQIEEDYVIFFQEDMWLNEPVSAVTLQKVIDYALENQTKLIKLHSTDAYSTEETNTSFDGFHLAKLVKEKSNYLLSHQVSIWDKAYFSSLLEDDENPWKNEVKGSQRMQLKQEDIFQIDLLSFDGKLPNNNNELNATRGAYYGVSVKGYLHPEINRFIQELKPERKKYAKQLNYHYKNDLKHNDQPKSLIYNVFMKVR